MKEKDALNAKSASRWAWFIFAFVLLLLVPFQSSASRHPAPHVSIEPRVLEQIAAVSQAISSCGTDAFGYVCHIETPAYIEAGSVLPLTGDDQYLPVSLPFPFTFYGQTYNSAFVCTNGYLNFLAGNCNYLNSSIPSTDPPNAAIYPFWDDYYVDPPLASVRSQVLSSPDRFVIEWRNVYFRLQTAQRVDYEVVLYKDGRILTQYRNISPEGREKGDSATVGIENESGTIALQYSYLEPAIGHTEFAVLYWRQVHVYLPLVFKHY